MIRFSVGAIAKTFVFLTLFSAIHVGAQPRMDAPRPPGSPDDGNRPRMMGAGRPSFDIPSTATREFTSGRVERFGMGGWRHGAGSDYRDQTSGSPRLAFRQMMLEELKHVPLLEMRVRRMTDLQIERAKLEAERKNRAMPAERPSEQQWRDYQKLVERDEEITTRQQQLLSEVLQDSDKIRDQIAARRRAIEELIQNAQKNPGKTPTEPNDPNDPRMLNRLLRFYDFVGENFENLRQNPRQNEWLRTLLRGGWGAGEIDNRVLELSRRRLQQLEQNSEDLRMRLDDMQDEIDELRETIDAASTPPFGTRDQRRPAGRNIGPMRPRGNADDPTVPGGRGIGGAPGDRPNRDDGFAPGPKPPLNPPNRPAPNDE